jgi:hypothetical protein
MPTNDFDQASRYIPRHLGETGFFRWLLGPDFTAAWRFTGWLDTQQIPFPGEPDRRCDTVAALERVAGDQPPLAVVVEFMSQTRQVTLRRLTQYGLQLQEDHPYQRNPRVDYSSIGAVVNLSGGEQESILVMQPPAVGGLGLRACDKVLTVATASAEALLTEVLTGQQSRTMLVWCPLMKGADTVEFVVRWRAEVEQESDARLRGLVAALALVLADLSERVPVWRRGLEGMDVERSQVVLGWENRGKLLGRREALVEYLEIHFGVEVAASLREAIDKQEDLAKLTAWYKTALRATSLEELQRDWVGE